MYKRQYTPRGRGPQGQAAQAAAAAATGTPPPGFGQPPVQQLVMSPDQFQAIVESCKGQGQGQGLVQAIDDGVDFPNLGSVAVKLPTFCMHDPELWFLQTEAVFNTRHPPVTRDATKFNHTVTALLSEALNACRNIIRLPVATAH